MTYDVLIIGGGPIGLATGLAARQAGLSYLIVEKGCLVNSLYHYPIFMTFFSTSEKLEIGGVPFVSVNPRPTRNEALEYYRRVAQSNALNIRLFETVTDVQHAENGEARFRIKTSKSEYLAENVVVATGFYDLPVPMHIPGEALPKVTHYYRDPHFYAGMKVVVVGANNSSVDAALETYRKGAEVTMVVRGAGIGERVKYWVRPDVENRIAEGSIRAFFNSELLEIREHAVVLATPDGPLTLENDFVIAATGYQPNFSFLRQLGVQLADDAGLCPAYDPATQESNVPGLYLAGVVCGGMNTHVWFIENSRIHAQQIVADIVGKRRMAM